MNAIVCEMCGSQDLVKQDGVYVCQHCGTKYSVEEAKKLFGEAVKIDESDRLSNLFTAARSAREINNNAQAAQFYKDILTLQPDSWEATFYNVYCTVANCRIIQIESAARSLRACLDKTFSLIDSNAEDKKAAKDEVALATIAMAKLLHDSALSSFNSSCKDLSNTEMNLVLKRLSDYISRAQAVSELLEKIGLLIENDNLQLATTAWKLAIRYYTNYYQILDKGPAAQSAVNIVNNLADRIRKHEPTYTVPAPDYSIYVGQIQRLFNYHLRKSGAPAGTSGTSSSNNSGGTSSSTNNGGCYVATAVYGSYDCPQVWTLRRYRDYTLAESWYGRTFIHIYYAISPTLVKLFGKKDWFKQLWQPKLDKMVKRLNSEGVADTPYEDRNW